MSMMLTTQLDAQEPIIYPKTLKNSHIDIYHNVPIPDPYRWLEEANSKETRAWIETQNQLTERILSAAPQRKAIKDRFTQLWNYEKFSIPFKEGGRYFFTRNDGLQNQNVLYTTKRIEEAAQVLLDPNTLSADGTVALSRYSVSPDGKYLAYALSSGGSDWNEYRIRDIETGRDLPDHIKWAKFTTAVWTKDSKGFFYGRFDEPKEGTKLAGANYFHKLYYHRIATPQSEDVLIYHRPDKKEWGFDPKVSEDGRYLIISVWHGTERKNRVYYRELGANSVIELLPELDAQYIFLGNRGTLFYFQTDYQAPRGKIIAIDINQPARNHWQTVIAESSETIENTALLNHSFVVTYMRNAHSQVRIYTLTGQLKNELQLPGIGSVDGFAGKMHDSETFYSYTSFTTPATTYRLNLSDDKSTLFRQPKLHFDPNAYEIKQIFYPSKDGTKVPMFIVHKKNLPLNGNHPVFLYGYGGFNISLTPWFSVSNLIFLELGGVLAVANLRGGGEFGKAWHEAGVKHKKQNTFDDFIAAAEWLIANRYTNPNRLVIGGGSNGGLLVGAAMTQRPDLFAVALPQVGVLDMLRFHKFTIGWAWTSDYGSSEDKEEFKTLLAYSPVHNLRLNRAYPATLITTGDHDDRVVPAHSYKFAATLQAAQAGEKPALIRIETRAGHGAGKPTTKIIEEATDRWAFVAQQLGLSLNP